MSSFSSFCFFNIFVFCSNTAIHAYTHIGIVSYMYIFAVSPKIFDLFANRYIYVFLFDWSTWVIEWGHCVLFVARARSLLSKIRLVWGLIALHLHTYIYMCICSLFPLQCSSTLIWVIEFGVLFNICFWFHFQFIRIQLVWQWTWTSLFLCCCYAYHCWSVFANIAAVWSKVIYFLFRWFCSI